MPRVCSKCDGRGKLRNNKWNTESKTYIFGFIFCTCSYGKQLESAAHNYQNSTLTESQFQEEFMELSRQTLRLIASFEDSIPGLWNFKFHSSALEKIADYLQQKD